MSDDTRENLLNSLKMLPENISDVIFAACKDKKFARVEKILTEEETENEKKEKEEWERTAHLPGGDYIESTGFTRTEENLDYMLKHYGWDSRNKTLVENVEFDAHREGINEDVHVIRIEHLIEPLATNISKKLFQNSYTDRYFWIAYTNSEDIVAFNLRDDGKYPNIPWSIRIFKSKIFRFA
jgi:hypothetical protein